MRLSAIVSLRVAADESCSRTKIHLVEAIIHDRSGEVRLLEGGVQYSVLPSRPSRESARRCEALATLPAPPRVRGVLEN
jgi:hypothetical protein